MSFTPGVGEMHPSVIWVTDDLKNVNLSGCQEQQHCSAAVEPQQGTQGQMQAVFLMEVLNKSTT